ncbi:MAG: D-Ala-D-Ala carboxypeptidase family metallohydrolase [Paracoccus sp. (in: a-proteobacteria)]|nr:D-Ala-D-Ala carboxypeptidase family metallohydrolase [Paracoccus sp. (in: a-proteobacteria)]MDO5623002.1 D-Ala-D-Ala carboxypeptidase family metallohydrolase [Paracoccus sp. (in: a-proteobacteria)]
MATRFDSHWRDVPQDSWRWPSFSPAEIACRGSGSIRIHEEALDRLQALRNRIAKPLIVRSAYHSPEHNRTVGGAPASKHMLGTAFDIAMANHDPVAFEAAARAEGFLGFGTYPRSGFMHIDLGPTRRWGKPFPARAGVGTLSAAGIEVLQDSLAEAHGSTPSAGSSSPSRWPASPSPFTLG